MKRLKWFPLVAAFAVIAFCFVSAADEARADGPLQRLLQAREDNRELVRLSNEDAAQARRDNLDRLRQTGPSRSCRGGSCSSSRSSIVFVPQSRSSTTLLLIR